MLITQSRYNSTFIMKVIYYVDSIFNSSNIRLYQSNSIPHPHQHPPRPIPGQFTHYPLPRLTPVPWRPGVEPPLQFVYLPLNHAAGRHMVPVSAPLETCRHIVCTNMDLDRLPVKLAHGHHLIQL